MTLRRRSFPATRPAAVGTAAVAAAPSVSRPAVLAALLLAAPLLPDVARPAQAAGKAVDQRVTFEAAGTIAISNVAGLVTVAGWDRAEVRITGELENGVERLDVRKDGNRLVVRVMLPRGGSLRDGEARLTLNVPRGAKLEISTVSAQVESTRVSGDQRVNSVSGDVGLEVAGGGTEVKTVSGDVVLRGTGQAGRVRVSSVSGDVRYDRGAGSLEASTVSGDLTLGLGSTPSLRLRSTSGDIRVSAASERGSGVDVESVSGDVTLNLKAPAGLEFEAESFSGDIDSCFGARAESTSARSPGTALRRVRGEGGARVRVKTMSGDISICDR